MNSLPRVVLGVLAAACCLASVAAVAQPYDSTAPLTRAQVRAEQIEWRQAGFDAAMPDCNYPQSAQRAGAIVAERRAATGAPADRMAQ